MNFIMLFKVLKNATFLKTATAEHTTVNNTTGTARSVTELMRSDPGHVIAIFWGHHISVYTLYQYLQQVHCLFSPHVGMG